METSIFQMLKGSLLCGPWSDLAEFQTHPSSYVCRPVYIGSCACVVKIVVKCSFEYLSVVYHTRRHPKTINIMQGLEREK